MIISFVGIKQHLHCIYIALSYGVVQNDSRACGGKLYCSSTDFAVYVLLTDGLSRPAPPLALPLRNLNAH